MMNSHLNVKFVQILVYLFNMFRLGCEVTVESLCSWLNGADKLSQKSDTFLVSAMYLLPRTYKIPATEIKSNLKQYKKKVLNIILIVIQNDSCKSELWVEGRAWLNWQWMVQQWEDIRSHLSGLVPVRCDQSRKFKTVVLIWMIMKDLNSEGW